MADTPDNQDKLLAGLAPVTRLAVQAQFFCSGFTYAIWGIHVPVIKAKFDLSDAVLSLALFAMAGGAMLTMGWVGRLTGRLGSAAVLLRGGLLFAAAAALMLAMPTFWLLIPVLMAFGAANSMYDVAMNAQATLLERRAGRPILSGLHGLFSVGGIAGALLGSAWLGQGWPSWLLFALTAAMVVAAVSWGRAHLLAEVPHPEGASAPDALLGRRGQLLAIGGLAFLGLVAEGGMYDWTSVYMRETVAAPTAWVGWGYAGFCIGMALGRFGGDGVRARHGAVRILQGSGVLACVGVALAVAWPQTLPATLGFFLAGLGCSNFVPVLFASCASIAGHAIGEAIALVGRIGYLGILLGPVAIGFVSEHAGLSVGLALMGAGTLLISLAAARVMAPRRAEPVAA